MKKYLDKKYLLPALATTSALVLLDSLFLEKYFFRINKIPIGNLQSYQGHIRILLLADLHFTRRLTPKHFRLAQKIRELAPELILITGDAIDRFGKMSVLDDFLKLIDRDIPKLAIMGNHEYKRGVDIEQLSYVYEQYNGRLLINETVTCYLRNTELVVTGVDDFIKGEDNFTKAVKDAGHHAHHLVMIHSPLQQEKLQAELAQINACRPEDEKLNISYIFAGHNHGGQVTFFGLFAPYLPKKAGNYLKGWYNQQKPYLFLSKGFGTSLIPFRFGARAEINLFYYHY
jgi:predicted MPP superfamily phosphohydrolase